MSDGGSREMTLDEYVKQLPESHKARVQYNELCRDKYELQEQVEELTEPCTECGGRGVVSIPESTPEGCNVCEGSGRAPKLHGKLMEAEAEVYCLTYEFDELKKQLQQARHDERDAVAMERREATSKLAEARKMCAREGFNEAEQALELFQNWVEQRGAAKLPSEERDKQSQMEDDIASEMEGMIREITMAINGDDEPAFLDDAVRRAIANAVATERGEIISLLEHSTETGFFDSNKGVIIYPHESQYGLLLTIIDAIRQRGHVKPPEQERERYEELISALENYIDLLKREISDMSGIARAHGWESTRVDEGTRARGRIIEARAAFIQPTEILSQRRKK